MHLNLRSANGFNISIIRNLLCDLVKSTLFSLKNIETTCCEKVPYPRYARN